MRDFRKLIAWQKAHALALKAHGSFALASGPVRNQLQRSITSIPANIAEGCGKRSKADFARYVDIALGSAKEAENHLLFAHDMGWLDGATFLQLDEELTHVRRLLFGLSRSLRSDTRIVSEEP